MKQLSHAIGRTTGTIRGKLRSIRDNEAAGMPCVPTKQLPDTVFIALHRYAVACGTPLKGTALGKACRVAASTAKSKMTAAKARELTRLRKETLNRKELEEPAAAEDGLGDGEQRDESAGLGSKVFGGGTTANGRDETHGLNIGDEESEEEMEPYPLVPLRIHRLPERAVRYVPSRFKTWIRTMGLGTRMSCGRSEGNVFCFELPRGPILVSVV